MQLTLCDHCPRTTTVTAHYRLRLLRLKDGEERGTADRDIDLCQKHYDELWRGLARDEAKRWSPCPVGTVNVK